LHLDFLDETLRRLAAEPAYRPEGWDVAEVRHFRLVAQCAQAAKVTGDLSAMRILRIQSHPDDPPGTSSIWLSSCRRLLLTFKDDDTPATAVFSALPMEPCRKNWENHDE
jgi:plasmid maintenance system killer protein